MDSDAAGPPSPAGYPAGQWRSLRPARSPALGRLLLLLRQRGYADRRKLLVDRGQDFAGDVHRRIARQGAALSDGNGATPARPRLLNNLNQAGAKLLLNMRLNGLQVALAVGDF